MRAKNSSDEKKELVLSVRGSATPMDWCINLEEASEPFEYFSGYYSLIILNHIKLVLVFVLVLY